MTDTPPNRKIDTFAEIAATRRTQFAKKLIEPKPPVLPRVFLPTRPHNRQAIFKPRPKIDTAAKLQRELERQRRNYARFMQAVAPKPKKTRIQLPLKQFYWRQQEQRDLKNFNRVLLGQGKWQKVDIPHYGGPLGRAVTYYRTIFSVTRSMLARGALFVCFKGADYKAHVFTNGAYIGSHEGFFAPFELEFTHLAKLGKNTLVVKVENDAICMGNNSWGADGAKFEGDKLYAATGPGYDDPRIGWHHCPPGMGIYQDVSIEARSSIHIKDVFVRPILPENRAEAWIEVSNCTIEKVHNLSLRLSVFGLNFQKTLFKNRTHQIDYAGPGVNLYRISFSVPSPRLWEPSAPWLYQANVELTGSKGRVLDTSRQHFGMRSFRIDEQSKPKGALYLNNRRIRLRGANTMGHMQQCVIKKDWKQLRDDILLAKICHMNFFRLTQRPVQPKIYDYCDRLGMMVQTDLPLFGVLRRSQFCEAVRQAGEMARLIRSHPSSIIVSYINEPFPNAQDKPHRHLTRPELEDFFVAADTAVSLENPDVVIKPVDGDYDPPAVGLPDNHCYCGWYNGHGLDLGKLHKGYWQRVKPQWHYGCGEFGAEGLDFVKTMRKHYPQDWLPDSPEDLRSWSPERIPLAQTGRFHYMWFDTQHSLEDWVRVSQEHQRWVTQLMTQAFRRDSRMNTFAIHLLIDAFPSGWMKSIMDFKRRPKPAYFAYREALAPLMVNLRTDRHKYFSGEPISLEAWICNDLTEAPTGCYLHYQLEKDSHVIFAQRRPASVPICASRFQGHIRFPAPRVKQRSQATIRLGLLDTSGTVLHDTAITIELFPTPEPVKGRQIAVIGSKGGKAAVLARELGFLPTFVAATACSKLILIDDYTRYTNRQKEIADAVKNGATVVFIQLPPGKYQIGGTNVEVQACGMSALHFVSRNTQHRLVNEFQPDDFKFWYDPDTGYVTPLLETTFTASGFNAILSSGNGKWDGDWRPTLAAAEQQHGKGMFRICQVALAGRTQTNPVAKLFALRLLELNR